PRSSFVPPCRTRPARTVVLWLGQAAMELTGMEALLAQGACEPIRPVLGPDEHQRETPIGRELAHERLGLLRVLHTDEAVVRVGDRHAAVTDLVAGRVSREPRGER